MLFRSWMSRNVARPIAGGQVWTGDGPVPVLGPSPGVNNLKWPRPVYAGETVTYSRTIHGHRPLASRPGWHILTITAGGTDSTGASVLSFDSAVMVKLG